MTDEKKFEFNEDIENDCLMTWKNARTLGRYKALCNERDSVDVKKYDCFFAFGNESFARGMKGIRPLNDSLPKAKKQSYFFTSTESRMNVTRRRFIAMNTITMNVALPLTGI